MDVRTKVQPIVESNADTLIVYVYENNREFGQRTAAVNEAIDGMLLDLMEGGDFSGKDGEVAVVYPRGTALQARRVIVVGLGKQEDFSADQLRRVAARGLQKARDLKAAQVATFLSGTNKGGLSNAESAQAITEGSLLGLYTYRGQKTDDTPITEELPEVLELLTGDDAEHAEAETGLARGRAFAKGTILARDLVNLPPNICTPAYLAGRAEEMAKAAGLKCEIFEEQQIKALKMGALLGVAQGSVERPRFIVMEHNADNADQLNTVVLVGKGVTFDTGGYSLKSRDGMIGMKADMGGGAAVIGAMRTIAALNVPLHVVGLVPASDNMISGGAYRPQEVLTASNGKTIEIISTDAEGRLLLADALVYAKRYEPAVVVDIATLTGSMVVALGNAAAGVFSIDATLRDTIVAAADTTGERIWPMPIYPEYAKSIESQTADMKNSGGRAGGAGVAAAFLKNFVDYPAWAHIDMAGMMLDAEGNPYIPVKGGTGYGARLLAQSVLNWSEK